jgi:hypothetical protein
MSLSFSIRSLRETRSGSVLGMKWKQRPIDGRNELLEVLPRKTPWEVAERFQIKVVPRPHEFTR